MASPEKLAIWTNRLTKEFEGLPDKLPPSVTQLSHSMDANEGFCRAQFRIALENDDPDLCGPDGEMTGGLQECILELDFNLTRTNYPFGPPVIKILRGAENIPPANLRRDNTVSLPELDSWTPSQTTLVLVLIVHELIMSGGPVPDDLLSGGEGGMAESFAPDQLINLDLFEGTIFSGRVKTAQGLVARYLGLTDSWALEVEAHKTRINWVVVVKAQELQQIQKLKFKRNVSITLIFKDESVWEFEMEESGECVAAIQEHLGRQGIQGRKTTMAAASQLERAKDIVAEVQRKEKELSECPTLERVKEIMDMYREATEKFASVSDQRHQEVVSLLHAFLQRPDVLAILETAPPSPPPSSSRGKERTFTFPSMPPMPKVVSQFLKGEVLFRSQADVLSEEDDGLAHEERHLAGVGAQLKKFMDLSLASGEIKTPSSLGSDVPTPSPREDPSGSPPSLSATLGGSGGSTGANGTAIAEEFQGLLGQATREFERLNSGVDPGDEEGEAEGGGAGHSVLEPVAEEGAPTDDGERISKPAADEICV